MRFVIDPDCFGSMRNSQTELLLEMLRLIDAFNVDYEERHGQINQDSKIKIFISYKRGYSSNDLTTARIIEDKLKREGYAPWLDDEAGIPAGTNWGTYIDQKIRSSRLFLAVVSEYSAIEEGHHRIEHERAMQIQRRRHGTCNFIIPIILSNATLPNEFEELSLQSVPFRIGWFSKIKEAIEYEKHWQSERLRIEKDRERPGFWADKHQDGSRLIRKYKQLYEAFDEWRHLFSQHKAFDYEYPHPLLIQCPEICEEHGGTLCGVVSAIGGKLISEEACKAIHVQPACPFVQYLNDIRPGRDIRLLPGEVIPLISDMREAIEERINERKRVVDQAGGMI